MEVGGVGVDGVDGGEEDLGGRRRVAAKRVVVHLNEIRN